MVKKTGLSPWQQVKARTGLSRSTVWRLMNTGAFPRPVRISPSRVAWRDADLDAWEASLQSAGSAGGR